MVKYVKVEKDLLKTGIEVKEYEIDVSVKYLRLYYRD